MATDDPILALEHQLVGAARRRASSPRRIGGGVLGIAAAVLVAVAVAAGGLLLLGGRSKPAVAPSVSRPTSSRAQLVGLLAVLRRPQTAVDLSLPGLNRPRTVVHSPFGAPDRPLIRLAAVAPWGAHIYLVPFKPLSARARAGLSRSPLRRYFARSESIGIVARGVHGGHGLTAAAIESGAAHTNLTFASGTRRWRLIEVVPDGVSRVALLFAAGALIETVPVRGNTAAFQVLPRPTARLALLWFGPGGQTIKRVVLP